MRHTPGPWIQYSIGKKQFIGYCSKEWSPAKFPIALVYPDQAHEANARLLVAAPTLLKELRIMAIQCCGDIEEKPSRCLRCRMAVDAILEAEGKER